VLHRYLKRSQFQVSASQINKAFQGICRSDSELKNNHDCFLNFPLPINVSSQGVLTLSRQIACRFPAKFPAK